MDIKLENMYFDITIAEYLIDSIVIILHMNVVQ